MHTQPPLSALQQKVALALAAGATISRAAEDAGIHRVTVYRWLKDHPGFAVAVQQSRAEFVLARRDDLQYLSNRALETVLAVLDDPRSPASVRLRASIFILQRPQTAGKGWCLPETLPKAHCDTLTDAATLEKECDQLAYIEGLEPEPLDESAPDAPAAATECNTMQQKKENVAAPPEASETPYSRAGLRSCPVPAPVLQAREFHSYMLDTMDQIDALIKPARSSEDDGDEEEDVVA